MWLAGAFVAIPAVVAAIAFVDASFELGMLHSTWQTGAVLFGAVAIGVYLLWRLELRALWQRIVLVLAYAPAMFAFLAWLGLVIQFTFDDCMAQQAVAAECPRMGCGRTAALGLKEKKYGSTRSISKAGAWSWSSATVTASLQIGAIMLHQVPSVEPNKPMHATCETHA